MGIKNFLSNAYEFVIDMWASIPPAQKNALLDSLKAEEPMKTPTVKVSPLDDDWDDQFVHNE